MAPTALPAAARRAPAFGAVRALLLADLRERLRSGRFRLAALVAAGAAWACLPPIDAGYMMVAVGDHHRGFYSSAWIGMVLAMMSVLWGLLGFYLVRGTVQRDLATGVWQLLAASAMRRGAYLAAKWASHVAVLALLLGVTLVVGLVAQQVRGEDRHVDLWELVKPALFIALPTLGGSAAFAVWFDVIPRLRGTAGNVVFFLAWVALLTSAGVSIEHARHARGAATATVQPWRSDLAAMQVFQWSIDHQVARALPPATPHEGFCIGCGGATATPVRFAWTTWEVPARVLAGRLAWLLAALAGVLCAAPLLDRAAASTAASIRPPGRTPRRLRWLQALLAPLRATAFGGLVAAEVALVLRMRPAWWWAAWTASCAVQAFAPRHAVALAMLAAWTLLLDVFARSGLRDREHGTLALVATAPGALARLLHARVAAGIGLALAAVAPALLHEALMHPPLAAAGLAMAASLALGGLALAALTGSGRPFELVFLVAAYATTQGLPWLDASARGAGLAHAALALACALVLATVARRRTVAGAQAGASLP